MFVGDLSDTEEAQAVREIAQVDVPKAVMLGNHDAWRSIKETRVTKELQSSINALGSSYLGYGVVDVPAAQVSVVGARPFSYGGPQLRGREVYEELDGVRDFESSAQRIVEVAQSAKHCDLIILAHNGPTGLGSEPGDFCGKDFVDRRRAGDRPGGDWGDRDLELAIDRIEGWGFRVRAVVAGHMHHVLLEPRNALRRRFVRKNGTLYVNCAVVPRIKLDAQGHEVSHFVRMTWDRGACCSLEEVWVDASGKEQLVEVPEVVDLDG